MRKIILWMMLSVVILNTSCNKNDNDIEETVVPVTGVSLDQTELVVAPGLKKKLRAIITPENASNKSVTWSSSNYEAIEIDETSGLLTVKTIINDKVTVTVKTIDGGFTANLVLDIVDIPAIGVRIDEDLVLLLPEKPKTMTAKVLSSAAANKNVTWESSNPAVASIDATTGILKGVSMGFAIITVTTQDGGFQASCTARVASPNLLKNNGFEEPDDVSTTLAGGWNNVPLAWFTSYYSDAGSVSTQQNPNRVGPLSDAAFFSTGNGAQLNPIRAGNWAGRIQADQTAGAYQLVEVTPGTEYWFSADIGYRRNNLNNHSMKTNESVKILSTDGSLLYCEAPIPTDPSQQFNLIYGISGQFIVPEGITQIRFQIDQRTWVAPNGGPLMVFDECEFHALPPWE